MIAENHWNHRKKLCKLIHKNHARYFEKRFALQVLCLIKASIQLYDFSGDFGSLYPSEIRFGQNIHISWYAYILIIFSFILFLCFNHCKFLVANIIYLKNFSPSQIAKKFKKLKYWENIT